MSDLEEKKPGVSRRTVAKAMAWSVPAVALAVPAPAYAASPRCVPTISFEGCRCPGQSSPEFDFEYFVRFCAVLPGGCGTGDVVIENIFASTADEPPLVPVGFTFPVSVPANGCTDLTFQLGSTNSAVNVLVQVAGFPDRVSAKMPVQACEECEGEAAPSIQSTEEQAPALEQQTAPAPEEAAPAPEETAAPETPAP